MHHRLRLFLTAHVALAVAASSFDHQGSSLAGWLFPPVVSAQLALLGVWLGAADSSAIRRLATAAVGLVALTGLWLTRPGFNGWGLLVNGVQLSIIAGFFIWRRRRKGLLLVENSPGVSSAAVQFSLRQALAIMFYVAAFLAVTKLLDDGFAASPWYELLLVFLVASIGVLQATIPLVLAPALLAKRPTATGVLLAVLVAACIAITLAGFEYSQTGAWLAVRRRLIVAAAEAGILAASFWAWRGMGLRLALQAGGASADDGHAAKMP